MNILSLGNQSCRFTQLAPSDLLFGLFVLGDKSRCGLLIIDFFPAPHCRHQGTGLLQPFSKYCMKSAYRTKHEADNTQQPFFIFTQTYASWILNIKLYKWKVLLYFACKNKPSELPQNVNPKAAFGSIEGVHTISSSQRLTESDSTLGSRFLWTFLHNGACIDFCLNQREEFE